MEPTQNYQLLGIVFGLSAAIWTLWLRHKIDDYIDSHTYVSRNQRVLEYLGKLVFYHKRVLAILIILGGISELIAIIIS